MVVLHACIFAQYDVLEDLVGVWAEKCSRLLVVEHPVDGKTKRIHCHFLIDTELADDDPFRTSGKKILKDFFKRGNYWIASKVQKGEHSGKALAVNELMDYVFKGKFLANFHKNFSQQEMEESRLRWVDPVKDDTSQDKSKGTERLIEECLDKLNMYMMSQRTRFPADIFDHCRNVVWRTMWSKMRIAPHASHYKIVVSSVFMRFVEDLDDPNMFKEALNVLKEKWY